MWVLISKVRDSNKRGSKYLNDMNENVLLVTVLAENQEKV